MLQSPLAGAHLSPLATEAPRDVTFLRWPRFQGTTGPVQQPTRNRRPPLCPYSPTCMVSPPPLLWLWNSSGSVDMNQFSLYVAMLGFCWLSVSKQLSVGSDGSQRWHEGRGAVQERGLDCVASHDSLSLWSYRPNLAPPVRQCKYPTMLTSLWCKPSHLKICFTMLQAYQCLTHSHTNSLTDIKQNYIRPRRVKRNNQLKAALDPKGRCNIKDSEEKKE